jgi:hypothetical protein
MEAIIPAPAPRYLLLRYVVWCVSTGAAFLFLYLASHSKSTGPGIILALFLLNLAGRLLPNRPSKAIGKLTWSWDEICISLGILGMAYVFTYLAWIGACAASFQSLIDALTPWLGNGLFLFSLWLILIATIWRSVCKQWRC